MAFFATRTGKGRETFMTSPCGETRRILWPDAGLRVVTAERLAAEKHSDECGECRRFLQEMVQASERLRHEVARPAAPPAVRDRLFKAVAQARIGSQRRTRRSRGLIAAIAVVVAVGGTWWMTRPRAETEREMAELLVTDHQRALSADGLMTTDTAAAARWLERQLAFAVQVPSFPGGQLLGARVVVLDGRRAAVMQYRIDGRLVSYYVSPLPGVQGSAGGMRPPSPARWAGYQVVSWQEPGLLHALVGNLPEARLDELARICIAQMGMTLSARGRPFAGEASG